MAGEVRVLVAEPSPLLRSALALVVTEGVGMTLVAAIDPRDGVVGCVRRCRPTVVILDDDDDGRSRGTAEQLINGTPPPAVMLLSSRRCGADVYAAFARGVAGLLCKDVCARELREAIQAVHDGRSAVSISLACELAEFVRRSAHHPVVALTNRESATLQLVAKGLTVHHAAEFLNVADSTAKTHLMHVYRKLGVSNKMAAVTAAIELGLLT